MLTTWIQKIVSPQLQSMPKRQRRRYIAGACRLRWPLCFVLVISTLPVALASFVLGVAYMDMPVLSREVESMPIPTKITRFAIGFGLPAGLWLLYCVFVVKRSVVALLSREECLCGYALSDLVVEQGAIQCPECGEQLVLAHRGLTPEMLLAGDLGDSGRDQ